MVPPPVALKMSCDCTICHCTVIQPDSLWYGVCSESLFTCFVCGTCLAELPVEARIPTSEQQSHEVTFGPYAASANDYGVYQFASATQMEPRFFVRAEDLLKHYPRECEFMRHFYPIIRLEAFLRELVAAARNGQEVPPPWEGKKSRHDLIMEHCNKLETFLGIPHPPPLWVGGEKYRVVVHSGPIPPPSPEVLQRVEAIWRAALLWATEVPS